MLEEYQAELSRQGSVDLELKIKPSAPQNKIREAKEGRIKMDIKAPPQKGKANQELKRFLASEFRVDLGDVKILRGQSSSLKKVRVSKRA